MVFSEKTVTDENVFVLLQIDTFIFRQLGFMWYHHNKQLCI